jgi:hypothetical protein
MMTALFSSAGMPLFAGFVTKFYLFAAAARAELLWLVLVAVINSTISLYYYLLVVYEMYVRTPPGYEVAVNGHGGHDLHQEADAHEVHSPAAAPALAMAGAGVAAASPGGGNVAVASGGAEQHRLVAVPANGHAAGSHGGNGHPVAASLGDDHGGHGGHGDHGDAHGDDGPSIPTRRLATTGDMPQERFYPAYRIPWSTNLALFLFAAGIFYLGLYPRDVIDYLQAASSALFSG